MHPDPLLDTNQIEKSLDLVEDDFSDIALKPLIFRRLLLLLFFLGILMIGVLCRISDTTNQDIHPNYNVTTVVTTQVWVT